MIPFVINGLVKAIITEKAMIQNKSRNKYLMDLVLKDITLEELQTRGFQSQAEFMENIK